LPAGTVSQESIVNFSQSLSAKPCATARAIPATALLLACLLGSTQSGAQSLEFTAEQTEDGKALYRDACQICHGSSLANGQFGTPLRGSFFRNNWQGKSVGELLQFVYEKMPPDKVMSLEQEQVAALVAYILSRNDLAPGATPLPGDSKAQSAVLLPW
jgi:mono/diheme cytochrome c family protein